MINRGWEAGVKALDRVSHPTRAAFARVGALTKRRAQRGLDTGRASATLLLSGECHRRL